MLESINDVNGYLQSIWRGSGPKDTDRSRASFQSR